MGVNVIKRKTKYGLTPVRVYNNRMRNKHRPKHIYLNNKIYFIAGRTYKKIDYFYDCQRKDMLKRILINCIKRFDIKMYAWVIMDNHYHILFKIKENDSHKAVSPYVIKGCSTRKGVNSIYRFINTLYSVSALKINKIDKTPGRKIWYQYWDHCIRNKKDFFKHFNYIHNNPIKHKKVGNINKLEKYKFSSFNSWINKKSREWIDSCFEYYQIKDFTVDG